MEIWGCTALWWTEAVYHVVWGGDELHSGVADLWSLVRLPVRPGDRVVHELVGYWGSRRKESAWNQSRGPNRWPDRQNVLYHRWPGSTGCTSTCAGPGMWRRGWCRYDRSGSAQWCWMWSLVAAAEKKRKMLSGALGKVPMWWHKFFFLTGLFKFGLIFTIFSDILRSLCLSWGLRMSRVLGNVIMQGKVTPVHTRDSVTGSTLPEVLLYWDTFYSMFADT